MVRWLLAVMSIGILLVPAAASARGLTIYCEYAPPKEVVKGSEGGMIYEQIWELMRRTGIRKPIQVVSWKRGYDEALSKPNIGLFATTRTESREGKFYWIGPILRIEWQFFGLKDSGVAPRTLEEAKKVGAIGVYTNDSKEQWLQEQGFTNLSSVLDNYTNLRKLYAGRIDLVAGGAVSTPIMARSLGLDVTQLVPVLTIKSVDLYLALSINTDPETVRALSEAFDDMIGDGTLNAIYAKWGSDRDPPVRE